VRTLGPRQRVIEGSEYGHSSRAAGWRIGCMCKKSAVAQMRRVDQPSGPSRRG
jgi:hypothetical protein